MILALLLSCADTVFLVKTEYCEDWAPGSDPELVVTQTDLGFDVSRVGVERLCDSIFAADVSVDGKEISVYEAWEDGTDPACTICYSPTLSVEDPPGGTLTLKWYDDSGQAAAVHTAEIDPDS